MPPVFERFADDTTPSPHSLLIVRAALLETAQQEEEVGREQRRKADEAVREAKALRKKLDRLKAEDRTASLFLKFDFLLCCSPSPPLTSHSTACTASRFPPLVLHATIVVDAVCL